MTPRDPSLKGDINACMTVLPASGQVVPLRPFLRRGDWTDDVRGCVWTVLTAHLHEDDEDDGTAYLWYEYAVVRGMLDI
jgi:hypothetical protein